MTMVMMVTMGMMTIMTMNVTMTMMTISMTGLYSPAWSLIPPLFPNVSLPFLTTITFPTMITMMVMIKEIDQMLYIMMIMIKRN